MISPGRYRAKAVKMQLGMTGTGKEQVGVLFDLLDHPGEQVTWFGFFTDESFGRTIESLRHCGWVGPMLDDPTGIDTNEVTLVIEQETYQGKTRLKVAWVNAPGGGLAMKETLDDQAAKSFAARMKGQVLASMPKQSPPPRRNDDAGLPPEPAY